MKNVKKIRPDWGSNPGSSVYETDALPLGHRATSRERIDLYIKITLNIAAANSLFL